MPADRKKIMMRLETYVLQMIIMEMTNDRIAQILFMAKKTVYTHRQNLINKLQAKNKIGLIKAVNKLAVPLRAGLSLQSSSKDFHCNP
ncbi:MAG TPA: LuxR C-terminal-related transcriptional regulator [Hanamia sp.]